MSAKKSRLCSIALLPLLVLLSTPVVHADTLLIEKAQQSQGQALPDRGMSMDQVEARFGAPYEVQPAVGEPPITRWVYQDFVVYFEYQYVIHCVLKRKP
jgi:hypothetical protein